MVQEYKGNVESGIKSKQRVSEHGEVYTPEWMVSKILDTTKEESYKIETKYLEPSCGNGNFLVQILDRKLHTLKENGKLDLHNIAVAVSNIYGIDILFDNICESKNRMLYVVKQYNDSLSDSDISIIKYILDRNIIFGNTLTNRMFKVIGGLKRAEDKIEKGKPVKVSDKDEDLIGAQWFFREEPDGVYVKRVDFLFDGLFDLTDASDSYEEIKLEDLCNQKDVDHSICLF